MIHPAFYIYLSNLICNETSWRLLQNRFKEFKNNKNISCYSLPPVEDFSSNSVSSQNIHRWWKNIEQQSIELALIYDYVLHTDINNCYGSIYTHSIAWAIHGKDEAKKLKNDKNLLGNLID
ncbi:hypothetical protein H0S56_09310 [Acinetobacter lwoffii]|uniref:hypothetical protein n=1 Tax=Acinetobacter lwoffii TaxID=28090 RepID=UPI00189EECEA|nr:hypothetical protein [Acinetobacter lwoffii]QPF31263.1 hypothetical protein H0S56_09310 [Acinetobacter lwoffii]